MCNRRRHAERERARERDRRRAVWKQTVERKPDLLSPKAKLTADVCSQILPLPQIKETHDLLSLPSFLPYAQIYKHAD